jgi:outer membrane protein assembly factor BamA
MKENKIIHNPHSSIVSFATLLILALLSHPVYSQQKIQLSINGLPKRQVFFPKTIDSITQLPKLVALAQERHYNQGYLAFSVDSVKTESIKTTVFIHRGDPYYIGIISINDSLIGTIKKETKNNLATLKKLEQTEKNILAGFQNQGFPFASIHKTIKFNKQFIHLNYRINKGEKYTFDSLQMIGSQAISKNYLYHKTGLKPNQAYSLKLVNELPERINQTGFITTDSLAIKYTNSKVGIEIHLKNQQQNSFSGIIGIHTNTDQKTEITGEVNMNLVNTFKKGELLILNWQKFGSQSQDLEAQFELPYIFNSPVGIITELKLYKQDSSYANTDLMSGLQVPLGRYSKLGITIHKNSSSAGTNTDSIYTRSENLLYGLKYNYTKLDNPNFSTKGIHFQTLIETGNKTNLKETEATYKSLSTCWTQQITSFIKVPLGTLAIKNQSALLINDSIYQNNLFRLGGFSSFRGFNEKSIYSKAYSFFTLEYRIHIGNQSYVYVFSDLGWFNEPILTSYKNNARQAYGIGLQLQTKAGLVSLAYAIGKSTNEAINISQAKIHIGYTNRF